MLPHNLYTHINKKEKAYKDFNFEFSEPVQAFTNSEPEDITDPLKIYFYVQKLFKAIISSKTILHAHLTLKKAIDYAQKIER